MAKDDHLNPPLPTYCALDQNVLDQFNIIIIIKFGSNFCWTATFWDGFPFNFPLDHGPNFVWAKFPFSFGSDYLWTKLPRKNVLWVKVYLGLNALDQTPWTQLQCTVHHHEQHSYKKSFYEQT